MFDISSALDSDSYKLGHFNMNPAGAQYMCSYGEARSDERWQYSMFIGPQAWCMELRPLTRDDVEEARELAIPHCGVFNYDGWMRIVNEFGGVLPIRIDALPEGMVVPNRTALYQVRNTRPGFGWVTQYVETPLLRAVWYPSSVATLSWHVKQDIREFLEATCDNPEQELMFRLHDFGARGASSRETAALGGMAHLVNFNGSDTLPGVLAARKYYGEQLAAYNIPAMEHSTVCAWGRDGEEQAYANAIDKFLTGPGTMLSIPPDAYDLHNAIDVIIGQNLRQKILASGGRLVVRPDSGDPVSEVMFAIRSLANRFGYTTNKKGYAVLHPSVRIIQGDGVNETSIHSIMEALKLNGFSIENVAFGMGGGLLQSVTRDTLGYAQKANAVSSGHEGWIGINKAPVTSRQKVSKKGVQMVVEDDNGRILTVPEGTYDPSRNLLQPLWEEGKLLRKQSFAEVRALSNRYKLDRTSNRAPRLIVE
jgi:nicotinamide phosphoribosyltransferase